MKQSKQDMKFNQALVKALAENLFSNGDLTEEDVVDKQKVIGKIIEFVKKNEDFLEVNDHTDYLLVMAKKLFASGDLDLTILIYATYFEHAINGLVDYALSKNGVSRKSKLAVLRSVNISGKCSWLFEVLGLPSLNPGHTKRIEMIAEERNAFVHYKWGEREKGNARKEDLIAGAKKSVTYIKTFTSRVLYRGKKVALMKSLTKRSKRSKE